MLSKESPDIIIEIGPLCALRTPTKEICVSTKRQSEAHYLSTLKRHENCMLSLCGSLFCLDYNFNLTIVNAIEQVEGNKISYLHGSVCTGLPTYQHNYGPPIFHESRIIEETKQRKYLRHDLPDVLQPGCAQNRPSWRNVLRIKDIPWLKDHRLHPHVVLPGSAYVCLALRP